MADTMLDGKNRPSSDDHRYVKVPRKVVEMAVSPTMPGRAVEYPVQVSWPELRLTEAQIVANAVAAANGERSPFPDRSIFSVIVEVSPSLDAATLDALWREIAAMPPRIDRTEQCVFCGSDEYGDLHADTCLWLRAQRAVEGAK